MDKVELFIIVYLISNVVEKGFGCTSIENGDDHLPSFLNQ